MIQEMIYEVYDKKLEKTIIRDEVVFEKEVPWCISFDNKYFFNSTSPRFEIKKSNSYDLIKYNPEIVHNYEINLWKYNDYIPSEIYRDFDIDELDPEVEPLVHALNTIDNIKTTGSCCGHEKKELWVYMICHSFDSLIFLVNIISIPLFKNCFDVIVKNNGKSYEKYKSVMVLLRTRKGLVGEKAYKAAKHLAQYIKNQYKYKNLPF